MRTLKLPVLLYACLSSTAAYAQHALIIQDVAAWGTTATETALLSQGGHLRRDR